MPCSGKAQLLLAQYLRFNTSTSRTLLFVDSGHYDLLGCWPMHMLSLNRVITGPVLLGESNCNIPVVVQVVAVVHVRTEGWSDRKYM